MGFFEDIRTIRPAQAAARAVLAGINADLHVANILIATALGAAVEERTPVQYVSCGDLHEAHRPHPRVCGRDARRALRVDRILIRDLAAHCIVGARDKERRRKQAVVINLTLSVDLQQAGKSDRLEDTVDYSALRKRVLAFVESSQYSLVEALAESIAQLCLQDARVRWAKVGVEKPGAARSARAIGVEIVRKQEL